MWTQLFLILLGAGAVGGGIAIALIGALRKHYRGAGIAAIGAILISAIYGAALVLAVLSAIYGTALIGLGLTGPERMFGHERFVVLSDSTSASTMVGS